MFHQRVNELRLTLRLGLASPLLVKAGEGPDQLLPRAGDEAPGATDFAARVETAKKEIKDREKRVKEDRERRKQARVPADADERTRTALLREKLEPDMCFVVTRRNGGEEPYLPGSGLKGALRSYAERWARTFLPAGQRVCDIFDEENPNPTLRSCTKRVEDLSPAARYAVACRICQIFGCGGLAGRLSLSDAYLVEEPLFGTRSGVGINRYRGAAEAGALFFYEVLEGGAFEATLTLANFELWQAGLLAHTLAALQQGELPVGFGARRGLGRLQARCETAALTYFGIEPHRVGGGVALRGVAALTDEGTRKTYGFRPEPGPAAVLPGATLREVGLRQEWTLPQPALEALWAAAAQAWAALCAGEVAT
jgi:CRISPR/Cas system CSM-associated protein Csm3 (group 7 of RAMP superfamily)